MSLRVCKIKHNGKRNILRLAYAPRWSHWRIWDVPCLAPCLVVPILWAVAMQDHARLHATPQPGPRGWAGMSAGRSFSNMSSDQRARTTVPTSVCSPQLAQFSAWASAGGVSGAYTTLLLQEEETVPDSHPRLSGEGGYFCLPRLGV